MGLTSLILGTLSVGLLMLVVGWTLDTLHIGRGTGSRQAHSGVFGAKPREPGLLGPIGFADPFEDSRVPR